ncbi:MAG: glucuronate isomerase [Verrucomicrobia bacterium]|nr:glucuronate isomerase [Verrucomicrobiota bacterium]
MADSLQTRVSRIVQATPVHDIHTHLYDPAQGEMLLWGIDELLVYHYLVSEASRQMTVPLERFWSASKQEQAAYVWEALFTEHSPISEACRGVLTTLHLLGIDARKNDLKNLRSWYASQNPQDFINRILEKANIASICMTNSPFDPIERPTWDRGFARDPRFVAALRIDPLLVAWPETSVWLREQGYAVSRELTAQTLGEVRRFLGDWTQRIDSRYCMVSLPPSFAWPADTEIARLIEGAVLPHCRDQGQAFALMMGVKRAVNPRLRMAGDGVGLADLNALQALCAAHPENRFVVTCLARENQHELVVLARKFPNLHPFGCWWFTNTPQLIREITTMRLELLGTSFTPQHSDARVLDQVLYKWQHSRTILAEALTEKYTATAAAGWEVTDPEIQRDVTELLGGGFQRFLSSARIRPEKQ